MSLGRRVTRPDPEALNPYVDRQDTQNLRYGVTGYLRRNRNSVTDVTQVVSADVVLITKENLAKDTAGGLEFTSNGHLTQTLSYGLSGNLFHDEIDATALSATGLKSTTGINAKASLDYHPTTADTAQVSFSRSDKRLTPQGYVGAIDLVTMRSARRRRTRQTASTMISSPSAICATPR